VRERERERSEGHTSRSGDDRREGNDLVALLWWYEAGDVTRAEIGTVVVSMKLGGASLSPWFLNHRAPSWATRDAGQSSHTEHDVH